MPKYLTSGAALGRDGSRPAAQRRSRIFKRSIVIAGHKTSISLEHDFWQALRGIAIRRNMRLTQLVTSIDAERAHPNLSSAIRLFVLNVYRLELEVTRARRPERNKPSTPTARSTSGR